MLVVIVEENNEMSSAEKLNWHPPSRPSSNPSYSSTLVFKCFT